MDPRLCGDDTACRINDTFKSEPMIDLSEMLSNLSKSLPAVQYLLGGLSYLMGIGFCITALFRFKDNVEKGQSSDPGSQMIVPFAYLLIGSALLYIPSTLDALSTTLFGSSTSVLQYDGYQPFDIYGSMTILIETVGLVWFIRGCVLLSHSSHPEQGRTGSKGHGGKGMLFIVAGLFGINFHSTVNMMNTIMNYLINMTVIQPPS